MTEDWHASQQIVNYITIYSLIGEKNIVYD
jgi:hypothetical protein